MAGSATVWLTTFALMIVAACGTPDVETVEADAATTAAGSEVAAQGISVRDVGLQTPESVLHDQASDLYLVSNINGSPSEKANNGFVTRLEPDGSVRELRWIEGGRGGVVLHAPKGMGIRGDSLFVADIDTVRIFHRASGESLGSWGVSGATFLNDISVGADGSVFVSDTGVRIGPEGMQETGTDAVYRIGPDGVSAALVQGTELQRPNGLLAVEDGVIMVPFGGNEVVHITPGGEVHQMVSLPAGQLDGVIRITDGALLVSSWEGQAVYRVGTGGEVTAVVDGVEAPADIGYDGTRGRLLIPLFMADGVDIVPLR